MKTGIDSAAARRALAALWLAFAVYVAHVVVGLGGRASDSFFNDWLYNGLLVLCALACVARGFKRDSQRWAWLLLGAGLCAWAAGDVYYSLALERLDSIPFPSIDDAMYLALYPPAYIALGLFVRSRMSTFRGSSWFDGIGGALAVGAVAAAVVFQAVLSSVAGSSPAAVATNLAYPLADLLLLGILVASAALNGWRVDRAWGLLAASLTLFAVTDSIYLYQTAAGTYQDGGILDAGWLGAYLIFPLAAWQPAPRRLAAPRESWRMLAVPSGAAVVGLLLLVVDHFHRLNLLAVVLATCAVLAGVARMGMTFVEYLKMIASSQREAATDSLTGLANRRRLISDLDDALHAGRPAILGLFDLDGFKLYNDTFGHPAGDALLSRIGHALETAVAGRGRAYRMGGDEFCVLIDGDDISLVEQDCIEALTEAGPGFSIKPSTGAVELPREAHTSAAALKTADQRMYRQKRGGRKSAGYQSADVLLGVVRERDRTLGEHAASVAELARAVALRLRLTPDDADEVSHAGQLHDIGKVGVPDAILKKPAALTHEERGFIERHPLIGERIVRRAPALERVARLVGTSHERWDGSGYPAGLAGTAIPLGARIVAACDAFDSMVSIQPYRDSRSAEEALAELQRCAGTQFDPAVVDALTALAADGGLERAEERAA